VTGAPRKLSKALLEDLSDARLLLETAAHNVQALIRQQESGDALDAALRMAEQAVSTMRRINNSK
jgi:hypothetical protein